MFSNLPGKIAICLFILTAILCIWMFFLMPTQIGSVSSVSTVPTADEAGTVVDLIPTAGPSEETPVPKEPLVPDTTPKATPVVTPIPDEEGQTAWTDVLAPARGTYIFPASSFSYLTEADFKGLSAEELRLGRNEIFARHGLIFEDSQLNEYFSRQPWYKGTVKNSDDIELNDVETANVSAIIEYESSLS